MKKEAQQMQTHQTTTKRENQNSLGAVFLGPQKSFNKRDSGSPIACDRAVSMDGVWAFSLAA